VSAVGAVLALLAIEAIGLAVFALACREPERWPVAARCGLAFGLGLIGLAVGLFAFSSLGVLPSPGLGAAIVAATVAAAAAARGPRAILRLLATSPAAPDATDGLGRLGGAALLVLVGLWTVASATSLLEPVVEWDVLAAWSLKAKVLLHEPVRTTAYFQDQTKAYSNLDYPLLWPLAMTWTWCCARTSNLATVKALSPALLAALAAASFGLLARAAPRREAVLMATVTLGLPMILSQTTRLLADAPLAFFVLAAFACCHLWLESGHGDDLRLSGLFAAGMLFTKNEGVPLTAILFGSAALFLLLERRARALLGAAAWLVGAPLVLTAAWFTFRMGIPKLNVDYESRLHWAFLRENLSRIPEILTTAGRHFASFENWSFFWPLAAGVVALTAPRWARTSAAFLALAVIGILFLYAGIFVISPWDVGALMASTTGRLQLQIAPLGVYLLTVCAREAGLVPRRT